jgi:thiol:disulfide interchange protein
MRKRLLILMIGTVLLKAFLCKQRKKTNTTATKPKKEKPADAPVAEEKTNMLVSFTNTDDIDGYLKKAKASKKVLFIDFYTTWCAPCKIMEQSVFRDEDVANYMSENCIAIRVNAEKGNGPNMKLAYVVDAYPTMLFYSPNGDEVARRQGSLGIEEFKKFMKAAVWKAKNPN